MKNKLIFRQILTTGYATCLRTILPLASLVGLIFFAGPGSAAELPFAGRIQGSFVANPTSDPNVYVGGAQAAGIATHLGAFTKVTSDVSNIATGAVNGAFTMTAPNGDLLQGVYNGFIVPGDAPGTFSWVLNATFTGGTGRFLHADGEFVFMAQGHYDVVDGVIHGIYSESFDGTINY